MNYKLVKKQQLNLKIELNNQIKQLKHQQQTTNNNNSYNNEDILAKLITV